jgi:hypothetical protein
VSFPVETIRRGAVITDDDGTQWRVTGTVTENGKTRVSKVRVGSLAEAVIFGRSS